MGMNSEEVLELLRWRIGRCPPFVGNLVYHLAALVLRQYCFANLGEFLAFCADPDNLKPWLPSRADRRVCSINLVETLSPLRAA